MGSGFPYFSLPFGVTTRSETVAINCQQDHRRDATSMGYFWGAPSLQKKAENKTIPTSASLLQTRTYMYSIYIYIYLYTMGPPNLHVLEVFMVHILVFRWPRLQDLYFSMFLGLMEYIHIPSTQNLPLSLMVNP